MSQPIAFLGDSLERLRAFPLGMRRQAGFQLDKLQRGLSPDDWKPIKMIGNSACEIRIRDRTTAWRIIYVACLPDKIYVLHAFQKKSRKTPRGDIELARQRYQQLTQIRR